MAFGLASHVGMGTREPPGAGDASGLPVALILSNAKPVGVTVDGLAMTLFAGMVVRVPRYPIYVCLWSDADRRPGHIHFVVQPVTADVIRRFGAHGPAL